MTQVESQHPSRTARNRAKRRRAAFTLIEILAVVVVIGILSTIAITKYTASKERAYITAMKADLRNLASTAESKYAMDGSYANVVAPQGSAGVTLNITVGVTTWAATATHANVPGITCTLSYGGSATSEPVCQ